MHWRIYSILSYIAQLLRIPGAIFIVDSIGNLSAYFVVISISIPAQFLAAEVLQYREIKLSNISFGEAFTLVVLTITAAHTFWYYGMLTGVVYVFYVAALLYWAGALRLYRTCRGANVFLKIDALSNVLITVQTIIVAWIINEKDVSYFLILSNAVAIILLGTIAYIQLRNTKPSLRSIDSSNVSNAPYYFQLAIMFCTQLERMVIGILWPIFLASISIAASLVMAWRKIVLDDAVLYEKLIRSRSIAITATKAFSHYTKWSWTVFGATILSLGLLSYLGDSASGVIPGTSVDLEYLYTTVILTILYMASLPCGIIMINLLRARAYVPSKSVAFHFGFTVILLSTLLFFAIDFKSTPHWLVWSIIALTASLHVALYFDFLIKSAQFRIKTFIVTVTPFLAIFIFAVGREL